MDIHPIIHLLMIVALVVISVIMIAIGRYTTRQGKEYIVSKKVGVCLLIIWLFYNAYYFHPKVFDISVSLPLHVCDLLAIIASITMIYPNRRTSSLLYFCGLGLAIQAVVTPIGNQSPSSLRFWLFWLLHIGIIVSALYDLFVRYFRPNVKDLCFVILCDFVYVIAILPIDVLFGWNYGYIGNAVPASTTIIGVLGTWPQRVLWMILIVIALQIVLYLPWLCYAKYKKNGK